MSLSLSYLLDKQMQSTPLYLLLSDVFTYLFLYSQRHLTLVIIGFLVFYCSGICPLYLLFTTG